MAMDPRKRQKKQQRRKAKQKQRRKNAAPGGAKRWGAHVADAPILHSGRTDTLNSDGICQVLLSRELPNGDVAFSLFLVDAYCLGVKNAMWNVVSRASYEAFLARLSEAGPLVRLRPEKTRKLVEGAVDYARDLGFSPHPDYRKAKLIFGDIDAAECEEEIVFGNNGKPYFVSGPYDSRSRIQQIINTLEDHCGPDGFHVMIHLDSLPLASGAGVE